ncbi:hypothetical protein A2673_00010 [Candidatus Kaiserbacteria bacterium RIFCSPHIGHO2_01_FULL_50_13]|uniref:Peptidoglycan binding-like domain-containing protein n=1 Tax=Candidatus Kaiserbacteria bacterium RIFCSPLOWO2_01_FULL_50_24 TaxID=1798507 RepID=A0A1F6EQZ3_9BACT|nr:MAG: hypothetical protein A2673_00010 [Candidatus Kaiserbacteria bacterium RIFCSPHIGHO2_01_FULL_50_13]OGG76043.1 MAG: hypothetical protein A3A34_00650 [Candidatus Kaiserbacteria bacterium RIFCSPLOWO2_01_FULL_50_24]OGG81347.1 MAG: hypothetical protein A3H74_02240 [Candidatus Kaiserbacteria bacterium RIFCSPLOWO2_02_FULL_51_13]
MTISTYNIKTLLVVLALAVAMAVLALPQTSRAAFDSLTFTTDVVLDIGGITVNVSGSSATLESIVVSTTAFTMTLVSGSTVEVTAPNLNVLDSDISTDRTINTCSGSLSKIKYVATQNSTVVITPKTALCADAQGGGGGGGGGAAPTTTSTAPAPAPVVVEETAAAVAAAAVTTDSADVSALMAQVNALVAQLTALGGTAPTLPAVSGAPGLSVSTFARSLDVGSTGTDVRALQQFLNNNGYTIAKSGPGSPGNETETFGGLTRVALAAYQAANGISPAVGYFGPLTRSHIAGSGVATPSTPSAPTSSFTRSLDVGSTGADVYALQVFLNDNGFTIALSGPGSPGNETEMFGGLTRAALAAYQAANGISPAVGYFGPLTRAYIEGM